MKISVVTVCLNVEDTIEYTIKSVLSQTYSDIEYIIMDGESTDGTLDIVNKYNSDSRVILVSEKDTGIYDAMNKSLDIATGDYIIFMNSGDSFYDSDVLHDVSEHLGKEDIVYGDVNRVFRNRSFIEHYKGTQFERMKQILSGYNYCHQSQFTKTDVMRHYRFDESHRITADYDFVVRAIKDKRSFKHIDRVICNFENENGVSSRKSSYLQMLREDDETLKNNFPIWFYLVKIPKFFVRHYKLYSMSQLM